MSGKHDAWPIDKLFLQMFTHNKIEHPLYHMAWADVCTLDTPQNQPVYVGRFRTQTPTKLPYTCKD